TLSTKVRYALTNTNQISNTVRNVEFTENIEQSSKPQHFSWALKSDFSQYYRMVGELSMPKLNSPYHHDDQTLYRTYWCKDPNYKESMGDQKHVVENVNELVDIENPLYCKENTFTVANQNYGNTTLALFEVTFTLTKDGQPYGDGNLYIKGGDNSKIYTSATDAASDEITRIKKNDKILSALTKAMEASGMTNTTIENATQYLDFGFGYEDNIYLLLTSISLKAEGGFNAAGVAKFKEIIGEANDPHSTQYEVLGAVNAINEIQRFEGGKSYYLIPIKHFGDEYCPWTETTGVTTEAVYNGNKTFGDDEAHARNYLGRYGMVRNNWYALSLNSVKALGSPKIPDITLNLSDDNKEEKSYIGVEIHILSWAKRTQSVEF
ncbi:MAG: Mfa1 fimbrilin C-terminal domain-containing protein, partial [Muribaculaceae bacterium]|nr:Mfa1 fimbrilin C-terminal domain-containing protein [Muribaculaceae bacterium]